jgi:hypothetical protein
VHFLCVIEHRLSVVWLLAVVCVVKQDNVNAEDGQVIVAAKFEI